MVDFFVSGRRPFDSKRGLYLRENEGNFGRPLIEKDGGLLEIFKLPDYAGFKQVARHRDIGPFCDNINLVPFLSRSGSFHLALYSGQIGNEKAFGKVPEVYSKDLFIVNNAVSQTGLIKYFGRFESRHYPDQGGVLTNFVEVGSQFKGAIRKLESVEQALNRSDIFIEDWKKREILDRIGSQIVIAKDLLDSFGIQHQFRDFQFLLDSSLNLRLIDVDLFELPYFRSVAENYGTY